MTTAITCTALLGLLVFGLGLYVSLQRGRTNTIIGHGTDPADPLFKAVRAHANATEFAPMLAILMIVVGSHDPGGFIRLTMWLATLSRYVHAAGMLTAPTLAQPHPLRAGGAVGTYVFGLILCLAAFGAR